MTKTRTRPTAPQYMEGPGMEGMVIREAAHTIIDVGDACGFYIYGNTSDEALTNLADGLRDFAKTEAEATEADLPTRAALVQYLRGLRNEIRLSALTTKPTI